MDSLVENCKDSKYSEEERIPVGEHIEGGCVEGRGETEMEGGWDLCTEERFPKGVDPVR